MRDGLPDAERVADRQHHIAHLQLVGIGELQRWKSLFRAFDAQHRKVAALIFEHDIGFEFTFVGKRNFHLARALDHMIVGDDEPSRIDDDAGTERALDLLARHRAEELAEERIGQERIVVGDNARGIDIDDCGRDALDDRRKGKFKLAGRGGHLPLLGERIRHAERQQAKRSEENGKAEQWHKNLDSTRPHIGVGPRL